MLKQAHRAEASEPSSTGAIQMAAALCERRGAQMTALRCAVLGVLWQGGRPLGAYELLSRVESKLGRKLAPATVYRVLEFLLKHRLIARIESRNAYVACAHPERPHGCVFFICDQCNTSIEVENPELEALMDRNAQSLGFRVARRVVEFKGTCAACCPASADAAPQGA
jgi:Fur family transcriptional regulator, zinc uptake regulator